MTTLPTSMTAIEITEPGGPEVLKPAVRPVPVPGAGDILIQVAAAGVNRPDLAQRAGTYPAPPGASDLPGLEVAGTVVALGDNVDQWSIGDAVCALTAGGGYAEYCIAPASNALPVPDGFSMIQAAALPETYFTVWHNLFERGRLAKGESVLIHGGASGIGTTAIQLAREWGARVFTTVGTADKAAAVEKLGAERAINYREEDFVEILKDQLGDAGVDVILDMVCGDYVPRNLKILGFEGRLVIIALLGGATAEVHFAHLMRKRQTITGSTLRPQSVEAKARIAAGLRENVLPMLNAGAVGPIIQESFALTDAAAAHAALEAGDHVGKFMLTVG